MGSLGVPPPDIAKTFSCDLRGLRFPVGDDLGGNRGSRRPRAAPGPARGRRPGQSDPLHIERRNGLAADDPGRPGRVPNTRVVDRASDHRGQRRAQCRHGARPGDDCSNHHVGLRESSRPDLLDRCPGRMRPPPSSESSPRAGYWLSRSAPNRSRTWSGFGER